MPTAPNGPERPTGRYGRMTPLDAAVGRHIDKVDDGSQLISVRHQPQGPVAYLFEPDDELSVEAIDIVAGNVVIQAYHMRWGKVYVLLNGSTVTEVALHEHAEHAAEFRQRAEDLDAAYRHAFADLGLDPAEMDEQDAPDADKDGDDE